MWVGFVQLVEDLSRKRLPLYIFVLFCFHFKKEVYLDNMMLDLKGKLSRIHFFRVIYPYLKTDCPTYNSQVQKL